MLGLKRGVMPQVCLQAPERSRMCHVTTRAKTQVSCSLVWILPLCCLVLPPGSSFAFHTSCSGKMSRTLQSSPVLFHLWSLPCQLHILSSRATQGTQKHRETHGRYPREGGWHIPPYLPLGTHCSSTQHMVSCLHVVLVSSKTGT